MKPMDETKEIAAITAWLAEHLGAQRFRHSLAVADAAVRMGTARGLDEDRLRLAGLVHDMAKGMDNPDLIRIAEEQDLISDEAERMIPDLLHAPVAALMARSEFGIRDEQVLAGVAHHTLGRPGMSDFEKVIFLADMVEPGRSYPGREELAALAAADLDAAMLTGLDSTIRYCLERRRVLHPQTVHTRNYFLNIVKNRP